jgi:uncharacterized membrane protein YdjX (TVP38/TMEM64 family)
VINVDQPRNRAFRFLAGTIPAARPATVPTLSCYADTARRPRRDPFLARVINPVTLTAAIGIAALGTYVSSTAVQQELSTAIGVLSEGDGHAIGDYFRSFGSWGPVVSLGLMLLQAILAPIPGSLIGLANGLAYGVFWGGLLTLSGQTLAAVVCFTLARHLGRSRIESLMGGATEGAGSGWLARWGAPGIVITRLVPGLSFDLISYAAGLTPMGFGRFLIATVIGSAPHAFLAAYLVQRSPMLGWAFIGIGLVAMGGIASYAFVRNRRTRRG